MTDETSATALLELATEITVAWLSNPKTSVAAEDLPSVIGAVHGALAKLGNAAEEAPAPAEFVPAVTVRRSLASKDHIISLIDGKPYKTLRRHLATHGLTPEQYRERYNLRHDYPMVAESYAAVRRDLAKKIGLGRKTESKAPVETAKPAAEAAKPVAEAAPKAPAKTAPKKAAPRKAAPKKAAAVADTAVKKPAAGRWKRAKIAETAPAEG